VQLQVCNGLGVLYESSPVSHLASPRALGHLGGPKQGQNAKGGLFQACIVRWPWTGWTPKRGTQEARVSRGTDSEAPIGEARWRKKLYENYRAKRILDSSTLFVKLRQLRASASSVTCGIPTAAVLNFFMLKGCGLSLGKSRQLKLGPFNLKAYDGPPSEPGVRA